MRLCCDTFEAEKTRRDTFCKEIKWNNYTWNREKFETRSSSEDNSSYSIAKYSKIKEKFSLNSYNGMIWRTERKDKFPFRKARQYTAKERNNTWRRRRREDGEKIWQIDRVDEKERWLVHNRSWI